jgi:hypothetical protein
MTTQDDLLLAIGRLEGKVDSILSAMSVHQDQIESLDDRVRSLEGGRSYVLGAACVLSFLVALIFDALSI